MPRPPLSHYASVDRKGVSPVSPPLYLAFPSRHPVIQMRFRRVSFYPLKFFFAGNRSGDRVGSNPLPVAPFIHPICMFIFFFFFPWYFRIFIFFSFFIENTSPLHACTILLVFSLQYYNNSNSMYLFIPDFFSFLHLFFRFLVNSVPTEGQSQREGRGDANRLNHRISFLSSIPLGLSSTDQ